MTTETILHGYLVNLLPRIAPHPPEVVITAPYRVTERYGAHDLDRWIAQLERELEVMRVAKVMQAEALGVSLDSNDQVAGSAVEQPAQPVDSA